MADHTPIEWTDATWNIVTGCSVVSTGCTNCYAMKLAGTRLQHHPSRAGLTTPSKAGPVWNGQVRFNSDWLTQPLRWKRPRRIFVAAHGDLFHDGVTNDQLDQVFAVMALCPQHTFQVLTKRPERMRDFLAPLLPDRRSRSRRTLDLGPDPNTLRPRWVSWPLPNVWLGVSVEDQARAEERVPVLLDTPAAILWISAEPLLGPIDLTMLCDGHSFWSATHGLRYHDVPDDTPPYSEPKPKLDWVVAGGESGPGARPMHPDWARQLRDQCAAAGVPFLFKQWGDWGPVTVEGDPEWDTIDEGIDPATAHVLNPRETCLLHIDGRREDDQGMAWPDAEPRQMLRLGKKETGRLLDGGLHDGFPEARS